VIRITAMIRTISPSQTTVNDSAMATSLPSHDRIHIVGDGSPVQTPPA
jgi:hypothetical protein